MGTETHAKSILTTRIKIDFDLAQPGKEFLMSRIYYVRRRGSGWGVLGPALFLICSAMLVIFGFGLSRWLGQMSSTGRMTSPLASPLATPTPTAIITPTRTSLPTWTASPTRMPTDTPTSVPSATATNTPTFPVDLKTEEYWAVHGPWLTADGRIWFDCPVGLVCRGGFMIPPGMPDPAGRNWWRAYDILSGCITGEGFAMDASTMAYAQLKPGVRYWFNGAGGFAFEIPPP